MPRWKRFLLRHAGRSWALLIGLWLLVALLAATGVWRIRQPAVTALLVFSLGVVVLAVWVRWQREVAVREAALPQFLKRKLREAHPHLSGKDCDLVERGLRQFFMACLRSNEKFVAMPSRVVDTMWHEFILHTRAYSDWSS